MILWYTKQNSLSLEERVHLVNLDSFAQVNHRILLTEKSCTSISDVLIISSCESTNAQEASPVSEEGLFPLIHFKSSPLPKVRLTVILKTVFEAVHFILSIGFLM